MRSTLMAGDTALYDDLLSRGVPRRRAVQLQNLMTHCGYVSYGIDCAPGDVGRCDIVVVTVAVPADRMVVMAGEAADNGVTMCIMAPRCDRQREEVCRAIVAAHGCTSVDNRGYLLLFNNYLPKQTFRL